MPPAQDHDQSTPAGPGAGSEFAFALQAGSETLRFKLRNPPGPVPLAEAVVVLLAIAEALTQAAEREATREGPRVSCGPKCGACCRQMVPISRIEQLHLQALVASLPDEERRAVVARFEEAQARLVESGLADEMVSLHTARPEARQQSGLRYFAARIPCPFLVEESCSIHQARPMACREYLVTSPASCCAKPTATTIDLVPIPVKPSAAAIRLSGTLLPHHPAWLPLVQAIDPNALSSQPEIAVDLKQTVHAFLMELAPAPA